MELEQLIQEAKKLIPVVVSIKEDGVIGDDVDPQTVEELEGKLDIRVNDRYFRDFRVKTARDMARVHLSQEFHHTKSELAEMFHRSGFSKKVESLFWKTITWNTAGLRYDESDDVIYVSSDFLKRDPKLIKQFLVCELSVMMDYNKSLDHKTIRSQNLSDIHDAAQLYRKAYFIKQQIVSFFSYLALAPKIWHLKKGIVFWEDSVDLRKGLVRAEGAYTSKKYVEQVGAYSPKNLSEYSESFTNYLAELGVAPFMFFYSLGKRHMHFGFNMKCIENCHKKRESVLHTIINMPISAAFYTSRGVLPTELLD